MLLRYCTLVYSVTVKHMAAWRGLPSALPIHNMDLLCTLSYLIWLTQCASVLLSASKELVLSLSPGWRDTLGSIDRETREQKERQMTNLCLQTCHKVATITTLGSHLLLSCKCLFVSKQAYRPAFICQIYLFQ